MMHKHRRHRITTVNDFATLAEKLTQHSWTMCTGFKCGSLILLCDASSEDGAQEYAVIRNDRQIESITCSWMEADKLQAMLEHLDKHGSALGPGTLVEIKPHPEGSCSRCA
jgi:hypothetical protein